MDSHARVLAVHIFLSENVEKRSQGLRRGCITVRYEEVQVRDACIFKKVSLISRLAEPDQYFDVVFLQLLDVSFYIEAVRCRRYDEPEASEVDYGADVLHVAASSWQISEKEEDFYEGSGLKLLRMFYHEKHFMQFIPKNTNQKTM